jgi:hypothetical protein
VQVSVNLISSFWLVTFTSEFFVDAILPHVVATKSAGGPGRRLVLHADNASPHHAKLTARNLE